MSRQEDTWKGWWEKIVTRWNSLDGSDKEGVQRKEGDSEKRRWKRLQSLVLLALMGAGMMIVSQGPSDKPVASQTAFSPDTEPVLPAIAADPTDVIEKLKREVTAVVGQIDGVGRVEVLIFPRTSEIQVFSEEITERTSVSRSAEGRGETVIHREESITRRPVIVNNDTRSQQPIVQYVKQPELAGVLIVADGAQDPRIRLQILKAVSVLLDIAPHRVEIAPRKK